MSASTLEAATSVPRLKVSGLSKSFFGVQVLHEVSFELHGGRVLGLVGENGSGKSTTMNLLTGVLPRDAGTILLNGVSFAPGSRRDSELAGVAFIQQELNIFPNLTVAENLFLTRPLRAVSGLPFLARSRMRARARELLNAVELNVSPEQLAETLSPGERQLLEIARGLAMEARVFILDEPTTSLTERESTRLFDLMGRLRQRDVGIIYISHNLQDVLSVSDDVVVMRDGRVTLSASSRDLTPQKLVLAMVGRPIDALFPERQAPVQTSEVVLEVSGLTEPGVLENVSLNVRRGEIVGLAGLMGSGRTELVRAIFGLDPFSAGTVRIGGQLLRPGDVQQRLDAGVAFLTEDRRMEGLLPDAAVADNMALAALPRFAAGSWRGVRRSDLMRSIGQLGRKLNLKSGDFSTTPIRTLSGGNQQKVILGRWLLREPKLFMLDEPTRGVDVGAKQEIYRLLVHMADAGMAILVISSELEELIGLCDRIVVMRQGEVCSECDRVKFDREALLKIAFGHGELT